MTPSPIFRVSVLSTGSVAIRPEHMMANATPMLWWLLTSRRWVAPRPINVYVIQHERGLVLFDTGQDRRSVTDTDYFPHGIAGLLYARLARFTIAATDTLTAQLSALGYNIKDVTTVVISHLHQDHMGGLAELAHAEILTSAAELAEARKPLAVLRGYLKRHILLPNLHWRTVEPEHDVFGDGTLVLIATPGHTNGSMSLLLRQNGRPPLLFVGDLTYDVRLLADERVPGVGNRRELLRSTRLVANLAKQNPGLVVLAAHDPAAAGLLRTAQSAALT
jgi:N-acyl homoserine lactone hydrolase